MQKKKLVEKIRKRIRRHVQASVIGTNEIFLDVSQAVEKRVIKAKIFELEQVLLMLGEDI